MIVPNLNTKLSFLWIFVIGSAFPGSGSTPAGSLCWGKGWHYPEARTGGGESLEGPSCCLWGAAGSAGWYSREVPFLQHGPGSHLLDGKCNPADWNPGKTQVTMWNAASQLSLVSPPSRPISWTNPLYVWVCQQNPSFSSYILKTPPQWGAPFWKAKTVQNCETQPWTSQQWMLPDGKLAITNNLLLSQLSSPT